MTPEEHAIRLIDHCNGPLCGAFPVFTVANAIRAAIAEERKACAALAMNWEPGDDDDSVSPEGVDVAAGIANAIRARGQSPMRGAAVEPDALQPRPQDAP